MLPHQGLSISGKTVLRLMREEGCVCRIRRRRYASYRGKVGKAAENVLNREFSADAPMTKLATDVTEFNVAGAKAYLSPVMDLFNNEIVAFSISRNPNMAQIDEMMGQLASLEFGESPLLHSDQGWQYQQISYQRKLEELGVVQSMSRKATCLDNACMEGFFGHMKDEFFRGRRFPSFESFKAELTAYIHYWNNGRYQVGLKGMTPVGYRGHSAGSA